MTINLFLSIWRQADHKRQVVLLVVSNHLSLRDSSRGLILEFWPIRFHPSLGDTPVGSTPSGLGSCGRRVGSAEGHAQAVAGAILAADQLLVLNEFPGAVEGKFVLVFRWIPEWAWVSFSYIKPLTSPNETCYFVHFEFTSPSKDQTLHCWC